MSINDNNKCSHWHIPITMHTNHKTRSHPIHSQKLILDKASSFARGKGMVNRPQFETGPLFRRGLYSRKYSTLHFSTKLIKIYSIYSLWNNYQLLLTFHTPKNHHSFYYLWMQYSTLLYIPNDMSTCNFGCPWYRSWTTLQKGI